MGGLVLWFLKSPKELNCEVPGKESNIVTSKTEQKTLTMAELWRIP